MKIHQLPFGARFRFQGGEYVKTGPMIGRGPDGPKMFPRYAELEALDAPAAAPKQALDTLARETVRKAFDAFCAECEALLDDDRKAALAKAREKFLAAID